MVFKVLGKCQLKEAVQDKTGGLDSIGNAFLPYFLSLLKKSF